LRHTQCKVTKRGNQIFKFFLDTIAIELVETCVFQSGSVQTVLLYINTLYTRCGKSQQRYVLNEKGVILVDGWCSWKKYVGNNTIYYGEGERTEKKDK